MKIPDQIKKQDTGLIDKNGNKISAGDIISDGEMMYIIGADKAFENSNENAAISPLELVLNYLQSVGDQILFSHKYKIVGNIFDIADNLGYKIQNKQDVEAFRWNLYYMIQDNPEMFEKE